MRHTFFVFLLSAIAFSAFSQSRINFDKINKGNVIENITINGVDCNISINGIKLSPDKDRLRRYEKFKGKPNYDSMVRDCVIGNIEGFTISPSKEVVNKDLADKFINAMKSRYNIKAIPSGNLNKSYTIKDDIGNIVYSLYYSKESGKDTHKVSLELRYRPDYFREENITNIYIEHWSIDSLKKNTDKLSPQYQDIGGIFRVHNCNTLKDVTLSGIPCNIYFRFHGEGLSEINIYPCDTAVDSSSVDKFINKMKSIFKIKGSIRRNEVLKSYSITDRQINVRYQLSCQKVKNIYVVHLTAYDPELIIYG